MGIKPTTRLEAQEVINEAAAVLSWRPLGEWPKWARELLRELEDSALNEQRFRWFLIRLQEMITARLETGKW